MTELDKATLQRWGSGRNPRLEGEPLPVQFNPATLRLALSNESDGNRSRGRQRRHFTGKSSTELSFDLVFDTADEATEAGEPVSVRERTALVEQFVVPMPDGNDSSRRLVPPRVRFVWGDLTIDGTIESLDIDFEHFSETGVPLRAKASVAIKEQDARYELLVSETAEGAAEDPAPEDRGGATPGSDGADGPSDRTGEALAGESLADFADRMGLDPAAWRGLTAGLDASLSLEAGLEIDFSAGLSAELGIGASVGFSASVGLSVDASLGLEASVGLDVEAGFALSAAGGVYAAIQASASTRAHQAANEARAAFDAPSAPASFGAADVPSQVAAVNPAGTGAASLSPPLRTDGLPSVAAQVEAPPALPPPRADPRAQSFGAGVPLAPRRQLERPAPSLGASARAEQVRRPRPDDPPWVGGGPASAGRRRADAAAEQRRCGCARPTGGHKS